MMTSLKLIALGILAGLCIRAGMEWHVTHRYAQAIARVATDTDCQILDEASQALQAGRLAQADDLLDEILNTNPNTEE